MQTAKIIQVVIILLIVALAASCAASKQYTSKLFPAKQIIEKDTQAVALRFLELDKIDPNADHLVTTDIIMGRDTVNKTLALDNLTKVYPATNMEKDSSIQTTGNKEIVTTTTKKTSGNEEPIVRSTSGNEVRKKKIREEQ